MLRWHREECRGLRIHFREESVTCLTCLFSYSYLSDSTRRRSVALTPAIGRRSCLNLTWPSSVKYSKECIVKPGGEYLSQALVNYLGNAPYNEKPDAQQDEKSKIGFPDLSSDHHVRVLYLSPARQWAEPLHGYLGVQDLNGRPHYEALSYTWMDEKGDTGLSERLYVGTNWDVLPITRSCSHALRRLRLEYTERPIWVDSICINQLNNVEKSHQIALMRTIYARSIRCIADLGEPSPSSDIAIEYANNPEGYKSIDQSSWQLEDDALLNLFRRKYFSRIWIIQEIVSAPLVKVSCGTRSVDLRLLVAWTPISTAPHWMQGFRDGITTGRPTSAYYGPSGLLQLLRDTADSKSSDPRDKISALLGLVHDVSFEGITADYDLTCVQVYTGLAAYLIKNHGLTELIMMGTHEDTNLQSWVPNWTALRQRDWTDSDVRSGKTGVSENDPFWETASFVLVNRLKPGNFTNNGYERTRSIIRKPSLEREKLYRPEIHGQTGALIHAASCVFYFQDPTARKVSSTMYTKFLWKASERDISQLLVVTLNPVIEHTDIIACFLGQKIYTHLRRTCYSTYRILGEAVVFLHELSERLDEPFPPEERLPRKHLALLTDYITWWCEKLTNASELWEIFKDPTRSGGLQARFVGERQTCMFYYRVVTVEEVYGQYLSLKKEIGSVESVLGRWIGSDGQLSPPSAAEDLIKCIIYWRKSRHWEDLEISLLPVPREVVDSHLAAWVNANTIRQRWLATEKLLAERHEMDKTYGRSLGKPFVVADPLFTANEPVEKIIEIWKDLTGKLVFRLNLLADAADLETGSLFNETRMQANKFDRECDEFLNDTFTDIIHEPGEMYRSCEPHQTAIDNGQAQVFSSSEESPGTPDQTMDLLGLPSDEGCYGLSGLHHEDWKENRNGTQCRLCIDLGTRYDTIRWEEHWKMPKSRRDIKTAVRALGITTYGDRRRFRLWKEPDIRSRRAAQVLGGLLSLSIHALRQEDMVII
ncbi:heterokaryon incompatibility protein-domain-containing protein [Xylaria castorea]|nr:heterokaryon incompatibility protein-domain-containing protein [Xylaria castorea]